MCNLYNLSSSRAEVAQLFSAVAPELGAAPPGNAAAEVFPGTPGLVLARGDLRQMVWGFPLQLKGAKGQLLKPRPVNNARTDKLGGPFWSASFRERRCLIPASAYAEAEGPAGGKTRSWFSVPGAELFAMAGLWRESAEWGAVYAMVMTEACEMVLGVHHRMPVILAPGDWAQWLDGGPDEAMDLCGPWPGALELARTDEPWAGRR